MLEKGAQLGPYVIVEPIGAGGMGEVWQARDPRLNRTVAIKVSNAEFSERFEREAHAVAALNHPHICHVYDVGPNYLVMEHIEGKPLAGPIPLNQALEFAMQIADALDAAHRKGIIHRDLKPANILVNKSGIKLLDFGLAKIAASQTAAAGATETIALTQEHAILGTLQYMAPEQLEGRDADARADIFAFGAVLYEMLTGRKAFEGSSKASLIAAIMSREPPSVSTVAPAALDHIIRRCLAKDPEDRWPTARDLLLELRWVSENGAQGSATSAPQRKVGRRLPWGLAAVLALVFAVVELRRPAPTLPQLTRFRIELPPDAVWTATSHPVISPDGSHIVFSARDAEMGRSRIFVRSLDSSSLQPIPGTDGGINPFWSPDSRQIGFFANRQLKKTSLSGPPQVLSEISGFASTSVAGVWGARGVILIAPTVYLDGGPIYQISEQGGEPRAVTQIDASRNENGHFNPYFLPDGDHFLFAVRAQGETDSGLFLSSLSGKGRQRVLPNVTNAAYAPAGYLLFARGALVAQRFDWRAARIEGDAVTLAAQVFISPSSLVTPTASFSISDNGVLVYRTPDIQLTSLVWFDRHGNRERTVGDPGSYSNPALSPDGKRLAVSRLDASNTRRDIWTVDLVHNTSSRFTFDPADDMNPAWSPDGERIAFSSDRKGVRDLYVKAASGIGDDQLLLETKVQKTVLDWSPDGKTLLYHSGGKLWTFPFTPGLGPQALFNDQESSYHAMFSPDGKWLAYRSVSTGHSEVYIQPFPPTGGKWQISTKGGAEPYWRRDGKELFYINGTALMSVAINAGPSGLEHGAPVKLFEVNLINAQGRSRYIATADGQRFLMITSGDKPAPSAMEVVLNWPNVLKR